MLGSHLGKDDDINRVIATIASTRRWFTGELPFFQCGRGKPPKTTFGSERERYLSATDTMHTFRYVGVLDGGHKRDAADDVPLLHANADEA